MNSFKSNQLRNILFDISLFVFIFFPITLLSQYDLSQIGLEIPGIDVQSVISFTSAEDSYFCIVQAETSEEIFLISVDQENNIYNIDEISISPESFSFKDDFMFYTDGTELIKYSIESGFADSISFESKLFENYELGSVYTLGNNIVVEYNRAETEAFADVGLFLIKPQSLEIVKHVIPRFSKLGTSTDSIDIYYEWAPYFLPVQNGVWMHVSGLDHTVYQDPAYPVRKHYSFLYDENLEEVRRLTGETIGQSEGEFGSRSVFTYLKDYITYRSEYTPSDQVIYYVYQSSCNSTNINSSSRNEFRLDNQYLMFQSFNKIFVYGCNFELVNTFEGFPPLMQNNYGLFAFSIPDGKLLLSKIHNREECQEQMVFTSQQEIDSFSTCEILNMDLKVNDGLDGVYDITSLDNLKNILFINGDVVIKDNLNLNGVYYFNEELQITGNLIIENNSSLELCDAEFLCNHITSGGSYLISSNGMNCSDIDIILENCDPNCPDGNLLIDNCMAAQEFSINYPYCSKISGDLILGNDTESTTGEITVVPLLYAQLDNIKIVEGNLKLHTISAIDEPILHIDSIGGSVTLNPSYLGDGLTLPNLERLNGSILMYSDGISFDANFDFPNLEVIYNRLSIRNYYKENLSFLGSLDSIYGNLSISDCRTLNSLNGLMDLQFVGGDFISIFNNDDLSDCSVDALCNRLNTEKSDDNFSVFGNAESCEDLEILKLACSTSDANEIDKLPFAVYPNPFHDEIYFNLNESGAKVSIFNLQGNRILNQILETSDSRISTKLFSSGTYILRIEIANNIYHQLIFSD